MWYASSQAGSYDEALAGKWLLVLGLPAIPTVELMGIREAL